MDSGFFSAFNVFIVDKIIVHVFRKKILVFDLSQMNYKVSRLNKSAGYSYRSLMV
jgi:hypothetical protein